LLYPMLYCVKARQFRCFILCYTEWRHASFVVSYVTLSEGTPVSLLYPMLHWVKARQFRCILCYTAWRHASFVVVSCIILRKGTPVSLLYPMLYCVKARQFRCCIYVILREGTLVSLLYPMLYCVKATPVSLLYPMLYCVKAHQFHCCILCYTAWRHASFVVVSYVTLREGTPVSLLYPMLYCVKARQFRCCILCFSVRGVFRLWWCRLWHREYRRFGRTCCPRVFRLEDQIQVWQWQHCAENTILSAPVVANCNVLWGIFCPISLQNTSNFPSETSVTSPIAVAVSLFAVPALANAGADIDLRGGPLNVIVKSKKKD
jgi:hypothetical protein